jgi:two-component system chemotaxis response regulator CheY
MKSLIVEDDLTSRILLQEILKAFGPAHLAVNGHDALQAVDTALQDGEPYGLICMDIMMPEMDGQTALRKIREMEERRGILSTSGAKIIMTTALSDLKSVSDSYRNLCDGYLVKPIDVAQLKRELRKFNLVKWPVMPGRGA